MLFSLVTLSFQAVFMKSYCAFLSLFSVSKLSFSSYNFFFLFLHATVSVAGPLLFQMHLESRS